MGGTRRSMNRLWAPASECRSWTQAGGRNQTRGCGEECSLQAWLCSKAGTSSALQHARMGKTPTGQRLERIGEEKDSPFQATRIGMNWSKSFFCAELIVELWLYKYPSASPRAPDWRAGAGGRKNDRTREPMKHSCARVQRLHARRCACGRRRVQEQAWRLRCGRHCWQRPGLAWLAA